MEELEFKIQNILGISAMNNYMQVPEEIQKLSLSTKYLATQLAYVCDDRKEEYCEIMKHVNEILS